MTVQAGDGAREVLYAADEIASFARRPGAPSGGVIVMPFVHLDSAPAVGDTARLRLAALVREIATRGVEVSDTTFGFHKDLNLDIRGYPGSVAFREWLPETGGASTS